MSMTKLDFKIISIKGRTDMFERKSSTKDKTNTTEDSSSLQSFFVIEDIRCLAVKILSLINEKTS